MVALQNYPPVIRFVESLAQAERKALGFIPITGYEYAAECGRLIVLRENGDDLGFALFGVQSRQLHLHQIVVRNDARRILYATQLLRDVFDRVKPKKPLDMSFRVAEDLEAHNFWLAAGCVPVAVEVRSQRTKRKLIRYRRHLPWSEPETNGSAPSYTGGVSVTVATWAHLPCSSPNEEDAQRILERRQLMRPPCPNVVNALDSLSPSRSILSSIRLQRLSGKESASHSQSVPPARTYMCLSG